LSGGTGTLFNDYSAGTTVSLPGVPPIITSDFNYWATGTETFGVNVPNGTYSVTLIIGDPRNYFYTAGVYLQGTFQANVSTGPGSGNAAEVSVTYSTTVTNGQLQVGISSVKNDAVVDGLTFTKTA